MTKLFAPKMPPAPKPAPTLATPDVMAAAEAERRRNRNASVKASTKLTGSAGVAAPTTGTTTLLGR
jgi:hypothetical protein